MCVGYFLVLLDVTIVNVALSRIATGTGASVSGLQWVVDSYTLALASLMLAGGTVGDLHGHRRVVLVGLAVFGLGSLGCGAAPGVEILVAARIVQGIGAALLLPGTLAIVSDTFTDEAERAKAIGIWAGVGSLALPAGPLIGGLLIDAFDWRAVFLLNVPIALLALPIVATIVSEHAERRGHRLDGAGIVLGVLLLLAATVVPIEAGREGVGSPIVPLFASLALLAPAGGRLVARIGSRLPIAVALLIAAAGLVLLGEVESSSSYVAMLPALLLWGIGLGILTPAVVSAAIASVPGDRSGLASAINHTSRQAGGAIGIALAGAIAGTPNGARLRHGVPCCRDRLRHSLRVAAIFGLAFVPGALRPDRGVAGTASG